MFDYYQEKLEVVPCNLCGQSNAKIIATKSANGLKVNTVMCGKCGLIYISPRMTKEGFDGYYKYFYRDDRSSAKGKSEASLEDNFQSAFLFGRALAKRLSNFIKPGLTIDVGSSTGGVLAGVKDFKPDIELLGIEPSLAESEYANLHGVPTTRALFEDYANQVTQKAANIICVQSLNHLLDPGKFIKWSFDLLEDGGHIILAVKNFRHQVRRAGKIESGVQIDHPYMFTPETLRLMMEACGFKVVYIDVDENKSKDELISQHKEGMHWHHIRMVGEKVPDFKSNIKYSILGYWKLRAQFWSPFVKFYYLLFYSNRLSRIKGLFLR